MKAWARERVLEQSRLWVSPWRPPDSTHTIVDGYEYYLVGSEATLMAHPALLPDADHSIRAALDAAARCGATSLNITVGLDYPGGNAAHEALTSMSTRAPDIVDVVAMDLTIALVEGVPVPPNVAVVEVLTHEQVAEFERTSARGWGYSDPSGASIQAAYRKLVPGSFLAHCSGVPAGTGGFTLVGPVARFWGASVVPANRGRGVYRGLVATRLANAATRGATLALVHAGPTSSPLLQRLGFVKFGERHTFRIDLDP